MEQAVVSYPRSSRRGGMGFFGFGEAGNFYRFDIKKGN